MTDIFRVACEVLVEADSAEEAQRKAQALLDQIDESDVWSSEVGVALKDVEETVVYRSMHRDVPGDIQSYGDRP